jgi:hypothetical protein
MRALGKRDRTEPVMAKVMAKAARGMGEHILQLLVVAGFALALAACDKCHMPTWNPNRTPNPPVSCQDDAPVR